MLRHVSGAPNYPRENLLRLMAAGGLSVAQVAGQCGLHVRTVRGILRHGHRPHARTLHRLARGLMVSVDEFFLDPSRLLYRRFTRPTNPIVDELIHNHREWFDGWNEAQFEELRRRLGEDESLTVDGAIAAVRGLNVKRDLHQKLDALLESCHADVASAVVEALYQKVVAPRT